MGSKRELLSASLADKSYKKGIPINVTASAGKHKSPVNPVSKTNSIGNRELLGSRKVTLTIA